MCEKRLRPLSRTGAWSEGFDRLTRKDGSDGDYKEGGSHVAVVGMDLD